jgi:cytochrome c-type biogenesis protein CcmH/NrfG
VDPSETFSSLLLKGDVAYQQGHYEEALASYKKAYLINSSNAEVKRKIAVVLTLLNRPEDASKYR